MCERRASNPGLHLTAAGADPVTYSAMMETPAYAGMQMILDHLSSVKTFTFTRKALDIYITARNNELPTDYWRIGFSDPGFIYPTEGDRSQFIFLDAQQFHQRYQEGPTGVPRVGYVNRNNEATVGGSLTVDPPPDRPYILELHYYPYQARLVDVDTKPWFPFTQYLVNALLRDTYYVSEDDQRWAQADAMCTRLMKEISSSIGDDRDRASMSVTLDPTVYSPPIEL